MARNDTMHETANNLLSLHDARPLVMGLHTVSVPRHRDAISAARGWPLGDGRLACGGRRRGG